MIKTFKHRGLEDFYKRGSIKGIQPAHQNKLQVILGVLNEMDNWKDLEGLPGSHLHRLKGKEKDFWSVKVSGNWRVIFQWDGQDVYVVDYVDYH